MSSIPLISESATVDTNTTGVRTEKRNAGSKWTDWAGIIASIGCAIHCAAMPFAIAFLPMLGLSFLANGSFHKVMVGVCSLLALAAFIPGWRLHGRWLPATVAVVGLSVVSYAAFTLEDSCACCSASEVAADDSNAGEPAVAAICTDEVCCEHCATEETKESNEATIDIQPSGFVPWITPLGGLLLVCAHLINRRFSCRCGSCASETRSVV